VGFKTQRTVNAAHVFNHTYKGLMTCGNCKCSITAETKTKTLSGGEEASYTYYRCTRKNKKMPKCTEPAITEDDLMSQLAEQIASLVLDKDTAELCLKMLKDHHNEMVSNRNTMLPLWRANQKDARSRLDELLRMRLDKEVSKEEYEQYRIKYQQTEAHATELINDSTQTANDWLELAEEFFTQIVSLVDSFAAAQDSEKRQLLLNIGSNWTLSNKKVAFTPRRPYDLLLKIEPNKNWRALANELRTYFEMGLHQGMHAYNRQYYVQPQS